MFESWKSFISQSQSLISADISAEISAADFPTLFKVVFYTQIVCEDSACSTGGVGSFFQEH